MDLINNLIYSALNDTKGKDFLNNVFLPDPIPPFKPRFTNLPPSLNDKLPIAVPGKGYYAYPLSSKEAFCALDDSSFIEDAIQKHWTDFVLGRNYSDPIDLDIPAPVDPEKYFSVFRLPGTVNLRPPYHLIYSYLVENTRIAQIFEKMLFLYMHDEKLNKATSSSPLNILAFQWMMNTENLFYSNLSSTNYRNIKSQFREHPESTRRNAYYRMFGMDLAFGDLQSNSPVSYIKAEFNNQPFIVLFEKLLSEIWQAYTNASNSSGPNTTDMFTLVDTAQKIQEMLMSRRTTETDFNNYRYFNLSKEEYSSVVMMAWLYEVISYDSPLIQYLRCNGGTPGERLINIGNKVGLPAHGKSEGLLDIAPPMNTLLRRIELGNYNDQAEVILIIRSQVTPAVPGVTQSHKDALKDLLDIINNWEKATGHRIKNPEGNVTGTVRIQQPQSNGAPQPNAVTQQKVLN